MPPQRTNSLPRTIPPAKPASKPVKSERTHEENQERAYIAASRRSDRSLEARVESARRASEIHKRRTGRALRVTEADVINEEMYEEEDDDTTHAYRNLGMLMGTGHQIDRRFHAYYAHQMQMKGIVDQMIQQQAQMQHGRAAMAGGVYGQNPMYSGGYIPQQQQQQQQLYPFFRQQVPQMAPSYRASPYSVPHSHGRAMSMHIPQNQSMRVPQPGVGISLQNKSPGLISPVSPALDSSSDHVRHMSAPPPNPVTPSMKPRYTGGHTSPSQPHQLPSPASDDDGSFDSLFPLTNELPGESARFLQGASETDLNMPYNFDLFDNTMYTTSKGFTTSLSPLQQNSPFNVKTEDGLAKNNPFHVKTEDGLAKNNPFYVKTEDGLAKNNPFFVKTEDGLATTTGELKWQPSKLDSSFPNNANLNGSLLAETINPDDDILSSLFMMPSTPNNFTALGDCSSVGTLSTDDIVDNEAWDSFMNQEWLDAGTVN